MNATAGPAGPAARLGMRPGMVVAELGWDTDVDEGVRDDVAELTGHELVGDEHEDVVDTVLLWWRDGDGDLVDALVDALTDLADGGAVWVLTPKVGRNGYVDAADIAEAAPTAGLSTTSSVPTGADWSATKLVAPKARGGTRR